MLPFDFFVAHNVFLAPFGASRSTPKEKPQTEHEKYQ